MGHRVLSFDVGIKNLAYCLADFDDQGQIKSIVEWDVVDIVSFAGSRAKTKSLGMVKTVDFLLKFLMHKAPDWQDGGGVQTVCIEQQLARAATMKVAQFTIYTFAKMSFPAADVELCHAKKKLDVDMSLFDCDETFEPPPKRARKNDDGDTISAAKKKQRAKAAAYRVNKQRCTWYTTKVLTYLGSQQGASTEHAQETFASSSKKDDLADSLMQAVAYKHNKRKKNA